MVHIVDTAKYSLWQLDLRADHDSIRELREKTLYAIGVRPEDPSFGKISSPLSFATYLALRDSRDQIVGFMECLTYDRVPSEGPGSLYYKLYYETELCNYGRPEEVAHTRSVYIIPEYRTKGKLFQHLFFLGAQYFYKRGVRYTTLATAPQMARLMILYAKLEATEAPALSLQLQKENIPAIAFILPLKSFEAKFHKRF